MNKSDFNCEIWFALVLANLKQHVSKTSLEEDKFGQEMTANLAHANES